MTLSEILTRVRDYLEDTKSQKYHITTETMVAHINATIDEMCKRLFLITDATTSISITGSSNISFSASAKTITISAGGLYAAGFRGALTFTVTGTTNNNATFTVDTTQAITDTVIPVNETPTDESGTSAVLTATKSITMTPVVAGDTVLSIDKRIMRISRAKLGNETFTLKIIRSGCVEFMDAYHADWENSDNNTPRYLLAKGFGNNKVRLWEPVLDADTLYYIVYRLVLKKFSITGEGTAAELAEVSEIFDYIDDEDFNDGLRHGVAKRALGKKDSEIYDEKAMAVELGLWEDYIEQRKTNKIREESGSSMVVIPFANL